MQGCTLDVFYFNGKVGKGKMKSFSFAGAEHLRREEIFMRKAEFESSRAFRKALDAGLEQLCKEKGPDSSSPISREVDFSWPG